MTDQLTFSAVGPLPITAVALLCLRAPWNDPLIQERITAAVSTPATRVGHQMSWSGRGVVVTVKTVTEKQSAYEAVATVDPEDTPPTARRTTAKNITKAE